MVRLITYTDPIHDEPTSDDEMLVDKVEEKELKLSPFLVKDLNESASQTTPPSMLYRDGDDHDNPPSPPIFRRLVDYDEDFFYPQIQRSTELLEAPEGLFLPTLEDISHDNGANGVTDSPREVHCAINKLYPLYHEHGLLRLQPRSNTAINRQQSMAEYLMEINVAANSPLGDELSDVSEELVPISLEDAFESILTEQHFEEKHTGSVRQQEPFATLRISNEQNVIPMQPADDSSLYFYAPELSPKSAPPVLNSPFRLRDHVNSFDSGAEECKEGEPDDDEICEVPSFYSIEGGLSNKENRCPASPHRLSMSPSQRTPPSPPVTQKSHWVHFVTGSPSSKAATPAYEELSSVRSDNNASTMLDWFTELFQFECGGLCAATKAPSISISHSNSTAVMRNH